MSRRRARCEFRFRLDGFGIHELVVEKHVTGFVPKDKRKEGMSLACLPSSSLLPSFWHAIYVLSLIL